MTILVSVLPIVFSTTSEPGVPDTVVAQVREKLVASLDDDVEIVQPAAAEWRMVSPLVADTEQTALLGRVDAAWNELPAGTDLALIDLRPAEVGTTLLTTRYEFAEAINLMLRTADGPQAALVLTTRRMRPSSELRAIFGAGLPPGSLEFLVIHADEPNQPATFEALRDQFRSRVVRRRGFFPELSGNNRYFHRYYYDGGRAKEPLRQLLESQLEATRSGKTVAITDATFRGINEWFYELFFTASQSLGIRPFALSELASNAHHGQLADELNDVDTAIFIFPFADTGNAAADAIASIRVRLPDATVIPCAVLTVESFQRTGHLAGEWEEVERHDGLKLARLLAVPQSRVQPGDPEIVRRNRFEPDNYGVERWRTIPTYEFWDLLKNPGSRTSERDPSTPERAGLENVPIFEAIDPEDLGWIVDKALTALEDDSLRTTDAVYVHPDEVGANAIAIVLEQIEGVRTIAVPKEVILAAARTGEAPAEESLGAWRSQPWFRELRIYAPHSPVVLIDEFVVGRTKLSGLDIVVKAAGGAVDTSVVVADFQPTSPALPFPLRYLYRFTHTSMETTNA